MNRRAPADSLEHALLQDSEQRDLGLHRQLAHFVEEDRPAVRELETAEAPLCRAGERAFFVAEQLRRDQLARDGGAVDAHEGPRTAGRPSVNRPGHEFFPRARLARNEHRRVAPRDLRYAREHRLQRRRGPDDLLEHRRRVNFLPQRDVFLLQSLLGSLAIVNIGQRHIPTHDPSVVVAHRIVARQKPAIASISVAQPRLQFISGTS